MDLGAPADGDERPSRWVHLLHDLMVLNDRAQSLMELLLRTKLTDQQRDFAATARAAGDEVIEAVEGTMEFLGIDSGAAVDDSGAVEPPRDAAAGVGQEPLRVLVVEDNPINQKVAVKMCPP